MQGPKTHEQFTRNLERKPDVDASAKPAQGKQPYADKGRQSEFPVSRQGMNQESEHNKHNHPPKGGQKH